MSRTRCTIFFLVAFQLCAVAQSVDDTRAALNKGNNVDAKGILEEILKKDKKNADAHYWLGLALLRRDILDADAAVDHMEEAVDLNPNNADYQYGLGAALGTKARDANLLKKAWLAPKIKSAFEKAVALNPKHIQAHIGLADFYQQAPGIMGGDNEKAWKQADAILAFQKYVELRPDTTDSYDSLAEGFLQKKDYDQAIVNLKKALTLDENFLPSIHRLALTYELKGQKKEAREAYQRVLAIDTNQDRRKNVEKKLKELQ